jgi:predicted nucleic acid-binding protein
MSTVLLDTNVVSYLFKGDSRAAEYAVILQGHSLAISFMTIAELYEWVATRNWGKVRIDRLEQMLSSYLVVPIDVDLCRIWGSLRAQQQAAGRIIAPQDAWIAATALRHSIPLVTHNIVDFQYIPGLELRSIAK